MSNQEGLTLMPILLHPHSRGTVRLATSEPSDTPLVDPDWLHDHKDVDFMVEGIFF